ncbi:MAG: ABC transporter ATP-binding protein [Parvibaculum sp.]|uniref:ABC transporter ATP-binding protein n=1 Tax=Parvibaculum sp. TaxID=2024848 RepID=UPI002841EAA2|nr:ABC transporter ATP-binding protein [Parvibaculum sp.]MDR3497829.1 ABC transporter ATP-binding protein [Parvibaculum sp.]
MNAPLKDKTTKDYSVFEDDIDVRNFDMRLILRLTHWIAPYRAQMLGAVALVLLAASAAVLAPVVVSRVVVDGILLPTADAAAPDFGQKALAHWLDGVTGLHPLVVACGLYALWTALWALFGHGFRIMLARAVLRGLRDLRRDLFAHLERLPSTFYDRVAVGRVMTRLTNDIETLFELLAGFGVLLGEFVPFFVAVTIMLALNPTLTFELLALLPLAALATFIFRVVSRTVYRGIRSSVSRLNENLQENLSGIEVVQLYGREQINYDRYTAINRENRHKENRAVAIESYYGPAMDSMAFLAMATIIWFGGHHVLSGAASLGSVILFAQFADMLFRPIVAMGEQWNVVFRAMASCERIFQALDWDEALKEPAHPTPLPADLKGKVEFRHLDFGYVPGSPILKDVSFTIAPGEKVAIVGPTGSGKTSLIRLLCRFYDVPAGTILLDGIDIMEVAPSEIRRRVGVVLQDFHIFSGSVYDNIALGNPNITRADAERAAKLVHADPFISALPQGYETPLTERGRNLSHGQRQLLAFARVLAMNPEVLILDEATASIDTETELVIQDALAKLTEGRTSIIIAHRLQTIREAHRIVVLTQGEVREIGTHAELIARGGVYKTLYELQVQDVKAETAS